MGRCISAAGLSSGRTAQESGTATPIIRYFSTTGARPLEAMIGVPEVSVPRCVEMGTRKQATVAGVIGAGLIYALAASADPYNPAERALGGGLLGAGTGAVIGAISGGGRGAAIGAAVGGGLGAVAGAATTPPRPHHHYHHRVVHRSY